MKKGWRIGIWVILGLMIVALAVVISPSYQAKVAERKYQRAQSEIDSFYQEISVYASSNGGMTPSSVEGLAVVSSSYLARKDPWGKEFIYLCPGKLHPTGFDLICYGADGQPGGEGQAKDIILGQDETLKVSLKKGIAILCPECSRKTGSRTEETELSYKEAKAYRLADGRYRLKEVSEKGSELCEVCLEKAEARTKLPLLVGKNKAEVADILGTPDSSYSTGLGYWELNWTYEGRPSNFRTSIQFRGQWNNLFNKADFTNALVTNVQMEGKNRNACPVAQQMVPSKLLKREPDRINVRLAYNQLEVIWYIGKNTYLLDVAPLSGEPVYALSKKVDLKTGNVKDIYRSSGVDWRQCLVLGFFQKNYHLETGTLLEETPRIK